MKAVREQKVKKKLLPEHVSQNFQHKKIKKKIYNSFPERSAERRGLLGDRNKMKLRGAGTNLALSYRLTHFRTLRTNYLGSVLPELMFCLQHELMSVGFNVMLTCYACGLLVIKKLLPAWPSLKGVT